jgi:hypothetical protein
MKYAFLSESGCITKVDSMLSGTLVGKGRACGEKRASIQILLECNLKSSVGNVYYHRKLFGPEGASTQFPGRNFSGAHLPRGQTGNGGNGEQGKRDPLSPLESSVPDKIASVQHEKGSHTTFR